MNIPEISRHVTEKDCAPIISHLKRRSDIEIHLIVAHKGCIDEQRLFISRLAMLHIDLAGHALDAIDNR